MKIAHIAIYCRDLERMKAFYETYFGATSNQKYRNDAKQFESYFLRFDDGARLELMEKVGIAANQNDVYEQYTGLIHFAVSVGSEVAVNALTDRFRANGYEVLDGPRFTGDGYYESVVLDPEQNRIEITV
jgi:lactoylglutathione lyase